MAKLNRQVINDRLYNHIHRMDEAAQQESSRRYNKCISLHSRIDLGQLAAARRIYENNQDWMQEYVTLDTLDLLYTPVLEKQEREFKRKNAK